MSGTPRICFWNYSDGDCVFMTQSLIRSMREHGVNHDFLCFSDGPVKGATRTIEMKLTWEQKRLAMFKIELMPPLADMSDYDYFVCIDSDSICLQSLPADFLEPLQFSPLHGYMETEFDLVPDCGWYDVSCRDLSKIWKSHGAMSGGSGMNSGIWVVERQAIRPIYNMLKHFIKVVPELSHVTDEVFLSWAISVLTSNPNAHKVASHRNHWYTLWQTSLAELPPPETAWTFQDWFSGCQISMRPAFVHLMHSKSMLIKLGKQLAG
jgi:hypothetical protein